MTEPSKTDSDHPEPPKSDRDLNGPGMTNGVPDSHGKQEATGLPNSDREGTEVAGGQGSPDGRDG